MQVVILAAGRGGRVNALGPKPLVKANGIPMIVRAVQAAHTVTERPILLNRQEHTDIILQTLHPYRLSHRVCGVGLAHTQSGAALTLLASAAHLAECDPVIVMDCDVILPENKLAEFAVFAEAAFRAGRDSAILAFRPKDGSSRYSFVRMAQTPSAEFPEVVEVVEKVKISDLATCGVHAFASWAALRQGICEMVARSGPVNGEYYLAPVHNFIGGTTVMVTPEFWHVGTPEELAAYEVATYEAEAPRD